MAKAIDLKKKKYNPYLDDKVFIIKFVSLLLAIIILATLGIFKDNQKLGLEFKKIASIKYKSLDEVEKSLNKKAIDTTLSDDDFNSLSELDLSDIELSISKSSYKRDTGIKNTHQKTITSKNSKEKIVISSGKIESKSLKKPKIVITSRPISSKNNSISNIKKRFYKTNSFPLAIKISQKLLSKKSYKKALKWAMIANEIDKRSEKSWILFAKAKVKLNQKKDAINALKEYLKTHNSTNVKTLLDDIQKDRKI